ncbi:MAG: SpoIIIAH-like family protein [Bacillota bacterium]|nr:SpoIIIAH-like family protein [Bacillota bacterium]
MKNKRIAIVALILCFGAYAITGYIMNNKTVDEDIPLHDGDVLVTSDNVAEADNSDTYMQELRANLEMDRNKIISMLTESESSASGHEEKKKATEEKMKLLNYMDQEATIETLIKNKGLPDTFVVISDGGINITVNSEDLDQNTVSKICEIVMRQTGRNADEIVLQEASR